MYICVPFFQSSLFPYQICVRVLALQGHSEREDTLLFTVLDHRTCWTDAACTRGREPRALCSSWSHRLILYEVQRDMGSEDESQFELSVRRWPYYPSCNQST